ncbi:PorP/SprF family type IX secretion system membrane protein [Crocinitomix algicola]|uniref:PorP/SprF family type IX secretion system membrane protein n=1 Tax=Crocinitomix algicola TaxID=1740263 RepID=UPI0008329EAB|nr:PorP/SprF family type IX secretion system membrane protein [Crocinitomix algicola]
MNIPENFDRWMFDYVEGNLSHQEVEELEQFLLQNPNFDPDAEAWKTATIPSESVVYPNQHKLERKPIVGWFSWSAAALLLLLVSAGGYLAYQSNKQVSTSTKFANADLQFDFSSNHKLASSQHNFSVEEITQTESTDQLKNVAKTNTFINAGLSQVVRPKNEVSYPSDEDQLAGVMRHDEDQENYDFSKAKESLSPNYEQEKSKENDAAYHAQYAKNPALKNQNLDLSKTTTIKFGSFSSQLKKAYRKIEKMVGYQTGIVNLRDPDLLMPENSVLASNPGFAGGMLKPRVELKYRNQWTGSSSNGHISQVSFDNYIPEIRSGVGVAINSAIYNDGAFADHSIALNFSPKIVINKDIVLEPGIKVSLGTLTGNSSQLIGQPNVELNRGLIVRNELNFSADVIDQKWYKDYGLGFVLNTSWFYAGFSADNLGNHYASVYRNEGMDAPASTPVLYNAIIGYDWERDNKKAAVSPFVSYRQFGELKEAWGGLTIRLNKLTIGGSYSTDQNFTGSLGIKLPKFKLTYQYDETTTLLHAERIASHNIGMRFTIDSKNKARFK